MKVLKQIFYNFSATDIFVIIYFVLLSLLVLIYFNTIPNSSTILLLNFTLIIFIFGITYYDLRLPTKIFKQLRYWYAAPLIFLTFKEFYFLVDPIRKVIFDDLLIKIDKFIFWGNNPTDILYLISNPVLTEILQIIYSSFYFLLIFLGANLIFEKKIIQLNYTTFIIVYGFFLSYIGYFLFPAIGPRFTIHHFENINFELPGLWVTNFLREFVNSGESIPSGTLNPSAVVQRDAFPSGHTQMTLLTIYLANKFKIKTRHFLTIAGTLLIFATVYLRYHYVVDLIGGLIFMIFTLWSGKKIYYYWENMKLRNSN